jgi:hypothetical protein
MRPLMVIAILAQVPNPRPEAPPGLGAFGNSLIAWMKWGGMVAGVVGLTTCGIMMAVGRRNRSQLAVDGATGVPWVGAGMALIGAAATFVGFFLS